MKPFVLSIMLLTVGSAPAQAGDVAELNFHGFSEDGAFLSFEEYGVQDGSGFDYSKHVFVDVEKNTLARKTVSVVNEEETLSARKTASGPAGVFLKELGIGQKITGVQVFGSAQRISESFSVLRATFTKEGTPYTITLTPVPNPSPGDPDLGYGPKKMITVSLTNETTGSSTVLQKDAIVPKSRGVPFAYSIKDIYLYKDAVAIFIDYLCVSFEGPDTRHLVVTGVLE